MNVSRNITILVGCLVLILVCIVFILGFTPLTWNTPASMDTVIQTGSTDLSPDGTSTTLDLRDRVVFIGGGTIDDNVASVLLFSMDDIDYAGMIVTDSDCISRYAIQNQWRLQSYLSKTSYPVTLSNARDYNPFPWQYRNDSFLVSRSGIFKGYTDNQQWPPYPSGEDFLKKELVHAVETDRPITLLITEPITPLTDVLQEDPRLQNGIKKIIWTGGAIDVSGNLDPSTIPPELANKKAEWNVFWDPYAVDWLFKNTSVPIVLLPLDVTNKATLTPGFMTALQGQSLQYRYSNLTYRIYSLVSNEPYYEMWNTLTASYVTRPDLFEKPVTINLSVITDGFEQGALVRDPRGRPVEVVMNITNSNGFYDYVLTQFRRD